jgi:hypothetical protein|tara:strand:+ start:1121 stop:1654 length:534 start_codon:yes stop_codon:yes gene_type:complete
MKQFRKLKSEIIEDHSHHEDAEGRKAKAQLFKLMKYSHKLISLLDDDDDLESWIQDKISVASNNMSSVYHYLDYEMSFPKFEDDDEYEGGSQNGYYESVQEGIISDLQKIAKSKRTSEVRFKNGAKLPIDHKTAELLLGVYNELNTSNRKKMETNITKGELSFMKMIDFAQENKPKG